MPESVSVSSPQCQVDANNNSEMACVQVKCQMNCMKNGANKAGFKNVTHVIFDLDGLLVDSEMRFANAIAILLKRFGKILWILNLDSNFCYSTGIPEYSQELQEKILGMEVARGIEEIIRVTKIPISVAEFMVMEREIYMEEMLKVQLMPGVKRLVEHFSKHNIPMAIATGSTKESYEIKVKNYQDLFESGKYFRHIVFTRDDKEVKRPKPAPDVYRITASRFVPAVEPENCLVFEDSSIGVDGARAAGMQCIMVPDKRFACKQKNATLILSSLEEFQPELFGLPSF